MILTTKIKQQLKAKAHQLKPIVMIGGKGLTTAVLKEIEVALNDHELIKIRVAGNDKAHKKALVEEICQAIHAQAVQLIGHICVLYRKNKS